MYYQLVTKLIATENKIPSISGLICKALFDSGKQSIQKIAIEDVEKKIPNTNELAKKNDLNTKNTEIGNSIPNITGLATTAALNVKTTRMKKTPSNNSKLF